MNIKQKIALAVGLILFALAGLVPPRLATKTYGDRAVQHIGRESFISTSDYVFSTDTKQLSMEWFAIAVITGGVIALLSDKKKTS